MTKTFTGPKANSQANNYLHSEGRQFTHILIEVLDVKSSFRIYEVITYCIFKKYTASNRKFIVLN